MKKMDQKISQMKEMDLLLCPKCREELHVEEKSLKCKNRHTYDVSKKGTVNFVLGYGEENYNLAMLEARERVMAEGFFEEILTAMAEEIYEDLLLLEKEGDIIRILDAGCGDGSHLAMLGDALKEKGLQLSMVGVDLSKDGILLAGRKMNDALYFVADLSALPFKDNSFDVVLNILSPASYKEFQRVLSPTGRAYKVIPGAKYLTELRKLYGLSEYDNGEIVSHLKNHTVVYKERDVRVQKNVEPYADDLLLMTPMLWDKTILEPGAKLSKVTIDVHLATFGYPKKIEEGVSL